LHSGGPLIIDPELSEAFRIVIWKEAISDFNSAISIAKSMHATVIPNSNPISNTTKMASITDGIFWLQVLSAFPLAGWVELQHSFSSIVNCFIFQQ
jgi:hypothetical protein